jgi:hypothetical protein
VYVQQERWEQAAQVAQAHGLDADDVLRARWAAQVCAQLPLLPVCHRLGGRAAALPC